MTAPRRRWSFGLRTLFVVVTLCALLTPVIGPIVKEWLSRRNLPRLQDRLAFPETLPPPGPLVIDQQGVAILEGEGER